MIADVIPTTRTNVKKEVFSYMIPPELQDRIKVGSVVDVPFGRKQLRGVVFEIKEKTGDLAYELKSISSVKDFFLPEIYIRIAGWIASYYLCSLGEAVSLFMPPALIRAKKIKDNAVPPKKVDKKLSAGQEAVLDQLLAMLESPNKKPSLLHGVTSSGKTEVYLKLVLTVLSREKQVIVLVPEIMLTPQTVNRFEEVFGDKIALIHSELSKSERLKNYEAFFSGKKPIIIGPRSALLVPSENIGLIIIDEEEDGAYKQEKNPKYHAVLLAERIAKESGALLLLGSATPSIESFYKASTGEYQLLELKDRYLERKMPVAELVDLRQEIRSGNYSPVSLALQEAIYATLRNNRHVFLFLNRRGAATFISCRECGEVIMCPNCSIPLVYHLNETHLRGERGANTSEVGREPYLSCHHCDHQAKVPYSCPTCGGYKIKYFGAGVERIEGEIRKLFGSAKIRRVDSRNLSSRNDYLELYEDLRNGEIDILIGTQIIAKGLDIPTVDMVGVVSADVGLHLPYYKANERTFEILTQVSGRSGRGENEGKTVIQTYWPDAKPILAAKDHNYRLFYNDEITSRMEFGYPPFTHLVRVVAEDIRKEKAKELIGKIAIEANKRELLFVGPAKAFFSRLRGKHRYHIIFKVKELPNKALTEVFRTNPYLYWDVDPSDLL